MLVTLTHPIAGFTGVVTVLEKYVLPFNSGTASIDLDPLAFNAVENAGITLTIGAQAPAPPYDSNLDAIVAPIVTSAASDTTAALRAAFGSGGNLADVTGSPVYVWHRGGALIAPEQTVEAFENAINCGAKAVKFDAQPLVDGTFAAIHDSTMDRTTNATGNVSAYTPFQYKNQTIKSAALAGPGWAITQRPPLVSEVIRLVSGRAVMIIEYKGAAQSIAGFLTWLSGLKVARQVIVSVQDTGGSTSVILTAITAVKNAGFRVMYLYNGATLAQSPIAGVLAAGATDVAVGQTYTDADITTIAAACTTASVPVHGFTINSRTQRDRMVSRGCTWIHTDDAQYLAATAPLVATPNFSGGVAQPGLIGSSFPAETPMPFVGSPGSSRLALPASTVNIPGGSSGATNVQALLGQLCPVTTATRTLSVPFVWDALDTTTDRWIAIQFGASDDLPYVSKGHNGYLLLLRQNGAYEFDRWDALAPAGGVAQAGAQVTLQTGTATAVTVAGTAVTLSCDITPTTLTAHINVGGTITNVPLTTDSTYRGGYLRVIKSSNGGGLAVSIGNAVAA